MEIKFQYMTSLQLSTIHFLSGLKQTKYRKSLIHIDAFLYVISLYKKCTITITIVAVSYGLNYKPMQGAMTD